MDSLLNWNLGIRDVLNMGKHNIFSLEVNIIYSILGNTTLLIFIFYFNYVPNNLPNAVDSVQPNGADNSTLTSTYSWPSLANAGTSQYHVNNIAYNIYIYIKTIIIDSRAMFIKRYPNMKTRTNHLVTEKHIEPGTPDTPGWETWSRGCLPFDNLRYLSWQGEFPHVWMILILMWKFCITSDHWRFRRVPTFLVALPVSQFH
jgi:hypothetical protein